MLVPAGGGSVGAYATVEPSAWFAATAGIPVGGVASFLGPKLLLGRGGRAMYPRLVIQERVHGQ